MKTLDTKPIDKIGIIYVAVDDKDANAFLINLQELIGHEVETELNFQQKQLETSNCFIESYPIASNHILRNYRIQYIVLSDLILKTKIKEISKLVYSLKQIKSESVFDASEISIEQLINILRNRSKKTCPTCMWYLDGMGICCCKGSKYKGSSRFLYENCELWETCKNGDMW